MPKINLGTKKQTTKSFNKKLSQLFYNNAAWKRLRRLKFASSPICEQCEQYGIIKPTQEVHHIKPVSEYPELALVEQNLESLCVECHNVRHKEMRKC